MQGAYPENPNKHVFHWYEMCDAEQSETYKIDDIEVSNFVLPLYFTGSEEVGGRNDFLGRIYNRKTITSFGINPCGYIGFFGPDMHDHDTYSVKGDRKAAKRLEIKIRGGKARRSIRNQRFVKGK